ncbi:MAG: 3-dehydroquinate synthase [Pseudomonadota bacterium]
MTRNTVSVPLPGREYDIHIGPGLVAEAGVFLRGLTDRTRVAIVTEERVAAAHLSALREGLAAAGFDAVVKILPPGEGTKSWPMLQEVVEWLLAERIERRDLVIAFGGGVIGDLVGFAAAILRRGVRFVQIPTTLLAQVDSSVGGKTGINSPHGKNLVGAFHQPSLVLADTDLLSTLPARDFLAGYAEVAKYGLLGDATFFEWLEAHAKGLQTAGDAALIHAVSRSCQMKAEIVLRDETEQGDRALLNLGHTFGHALEAATGYSDRLLHGEGVSVGCVLAADVSARLGLCAQETPARVAAHFADLGMVHRLVDIPGDLPDADGLLELMMQDKKVLDGTLTFILLHDIGTAKVHRDVPLQVVRDVLEEALAAR